MTAEQFKREARQKGMSENAIECQMKLQEKLRAEGLPPISYEEILAAQSQRSCIRVFEQHRPDFA